ncbi:MAG: glycosyltransferase, partial [Holosporaceae bacterium]|nr:glycosyltransferase [Holosporaceae bacterium]
MQEHLKNLSSPKAESTSTNPFMSVIIPAYNAESTIWRCIRSLEAALCQIEHEILIIDDASTDNTAAIVQKLTEVYENVRLIRQEKNAGSGLARNRGMAESRGEFVWFVDADDEVPVENFRDFDIKQACQDRDIVMFGYNQVIPGVEGIQRCDQFDAKIMAARPADDFTVKEFPTVLIFCNVVWNKFFRRESILGSGMEFPNTAVHDDLPFAIANLCAAKSIRFIDRELYTYHRDASTVFYIADQRRLQILQALKICEEWLERNNVSSDVWTSYYVCKIHNILFSYDRLDAKLHAWMRQYFNDFLRSLDQHTFIRLLQHPFLDNRARQRILELHDLKVNSRRLSNGDTRNQPSFLSVIIPAYNAEKTIGRCVGSLCAAFGQIDYEILVVDDASTDGTVSMVQKLSEVYENVRLIRQRKNQGQGPTRNRGLREARGEFIWFVDADDEVPIGNFQNLDLRQVCADHDVVMFRYNQLSPGIKSMQPWLEYDEKVMMTRPANVFTVEGFPSVLSTTSAVWNKFFRRESVIAAGMEFPDSIVSEDQPFVIANLCAAKSIRFINRELYTYHLDASSMSRIADERRLQSLWALKTCEDWLGKRHLDPNVLVSYHVCKVHHLHLNCGLATDQSRDILLKYMNNYLKSLDDE